MRRPFLKLENSPTTRHRSLHSTPRRRWKPDGSTSQRRLRYVEEISERATATANNALAPDATLCRSVFHARRAGDKGELAK